MIELLPLRFLESIKGIHLLGDHALFVTNRRVVLVSLQANMPCATPPHRTQRPAQTKPDFN